MRSYELILHICTRAHLLSRAHKYSDFAFSGFLKQLPFFNLGVGFVYKAHLAFGDTALNQFFANVGIYGKLRVGFKSRQVAEYKLS